MRAGAPKPHRSRIRKFLNYASPVLDVSAAASDALPPLKGAIGVARWIVNAVQGFEDNQEEWRSLANHIQDVVDAVPGEGQQSLLQEREAKLNSVLSEIKTEIEDLQAQSSRKQWLAFLKDRTKINGYKSRVDQAVAVFSTGTAVALHRSAIASRRTARATHRMTVATHRSVAATHRTATAALWSSNSTRRKLAKLHRELAGLRAFQADAIDTFKRWERRTAEQILEPWSLQWFLREVKPNTTQTAVLFAS